jgi:hypothetical protein
MIRLLGSDMMTKFINLYEFKRNRLLKTKN